METEEIHWWAEEFVYHKKSVDWYWYFGLVVVILISFALYASNTLFAFVIGIGAFTILLYAAKKPETIEYVATKRSIKAGKDLYPYSEIASFWIPTPKKETEEKIILIRSQKVSSPLIVLPLGDADIDELHDFLKNFIEEREDQLPIGQVFMNIIGF
ncbi:MAG: hypothetical protein NTZ13_00945 [Candidatus Parcubacteria bacterium]|nr:hypothetical protein [Candidatus Parcubacteria bacterium]